MTERSPQSFRSRRPGVTATVAVIIGGLVAVLAALLLWGAARDGALVGPGAAMLLLAVLSAVIGIVGFRVARAPREAAPMTGPVQLLTILVFVVGVTGAVLGVVIGGIQGSIPAIGTGVLTLVLGLVIALQGALLYGAAQHGS